MMLKSKMTTSLIPAALVVLAAAHVSAFDVAKTSLSLTSRYSPVVEQQAPKTTLLAPPTYEYVDPGFFYTADYPYLFFHNMAGLGLYPWTPELQQFMSRFDTIWAGNVFALPPSWVNHFHTADGKRRTLIFYEYFSGIHFIFGKSNPQPYEAWQVTFLDDHKSDFYTINPLIPPGFVEFSPGRYAPGLGLLDYFINYGVTGGGAEALLVNQFYDGKRAAWGYDGVFFDLTGSSFMSVAEIQDPNNAANFLSAQAQYDFLSFTRADPLKTYDENGAAFFSTLRAKNPSLSEFPIWANQAFRSGNTTTHENPYYQYIQSDLDESTFTTWYNPDGWTTGVRVNVDGVWYENAAPVETKIVPFLDGVQSLQPIVNQSIYAQSNYGNAVNGVILNYLRPYYRPFEDGYEAVVDREAIFYGYATGQATGLASFNWDFFDTFVTIPGVPGAPASTGLPTQGYYRWAFDPIYFLDLGAKLSSGYDLIAGESGGQAAFSAFEKGFIIVNASVPAGDVTVDLATRIKTLPDGVSGYYDHFTGTAIPVSQQIFTVQAPYYPIGDVYTNGARVYSYTDAEGNLIGSNASVSDAFLLY